MQIILVIFLSLLQHHLKFNTLIQQKMPKFAFCHPVYVQRPLEFMGICWYVAKASKAKTFYHSFLPVETLAIFCQSLLRKFFLPSFLLLYFLSPTLNILSFVFFSLVTVELEYFWFKRVVEIITFINMNYLNERENFKFLMKSGID